MASYGMPAPLRWIFGTRLGSFLLVVGLPVLLVTGVMSIEWDSTGPHFRFNRDRAQEIRQEIHENAVNTVRQYQDRLPVEVDGNFLNPGAGSGTTVTPPPAAAPYQTTAPYEVNPRYQTNPPYLTSPPYPAAPPYPSGTPYENGLAPNPTARTFNPYDTTR